MVAPITYKPAVADTNNFDGAGSYYVYKAASKQKRPYNLPAKYLMHRVNTIDARKFGTMTTFAGLAKASASKGIYLSGPDIGSWLSNEINQVKTMAREKLVGELNEAAEMAVNFAERKQAISMMEKRIFSLVQTARCLKRFDVLGALRALSITRPVSIKKPRPRYTGAKWFADAWLELHFGWVPLVQDIGNAVNILQAPLPCGTYTVKRKIDLDLSQFTLIGIPPTSYQKRSCKGKLIGKAGAELFVTNGDAYLASRLGFENPVSIAWELVPFSFVVDWFVNTNTFISQWTDFQGCTVLNPWHSWTAIIGNSRYEERTWPDRSEGGRDIQYTSLHSQRLLGLPQVTLGFRAPKRLSTVRAATAMSLLIQLLPSK